MFTFYLIGCVLSFILIIYTEYDNMKKPDAQLGMLVPAVMLSWVTALIIIYNLFFRK